MAASRVLLLSWLLILMCFTPNIRASFLLDDIFGGVDSCESVCENTFPLHTYEKAIHLGYCRRGCRLFTIIDFAESCDNLNDTREACQQACSEAYVVEDNINACNLGCTSQLPIMEKRQQQLQNMELQSNSMFPLMYVHNWYSNMVDKVSQQMTVRWTFYSQSDNGPLVVIRSEPQLFISDDGGDDYKTSNYIESNLPEVDNSATPDLRNSQVHAMERDVTEDKMPNHAQNADWLSCISKKMGVPRMLLTGTIFVSAFVMIWICLSSAVTAPEQKVAAQPQQKLSIYGDLEYLRDFGDKPLLPSFPQELNQNAPPLPIKVKVERV